MVDPAPRKGRKGFFFWLAYYLALTGPLQAFSSVISNRITYGDFAPGTEDRH